MPHIPDPPLYRKQLPANEICYEPGRSSVNLAVPPAGRMPDSGLRASAEEREKGHPGPLDNRTARP